MSAGLKNVCRTSAAARRQQEDGRQRREHDHGARGGQRGAPAAAVAQHPGPPGRQVRKPLFGALRLTYGWMVGTLVKSFRYCPVSLASVPLPFSVASALFTQVTSLLPLANSRP